MPTLPPADLVEAAVWLALLLTAGFLAAPAARLILPGQRDGGWLSGLLLGWTVGGALPWALAALGLADFARHGTLIGTAGLVALWAWTRGRAPAAGVRRRDVAAMLALFVLLFALGLFQRLGAPDLDNLEKFTDMGFLAAAMRAAAMPPPDAWWGGAPINYYYVGHAIVAAWGNAAAVPADHAYQLGMASLFALTGAAAFTLARELVPRAAPRLADLAGLFAAALVLWGGNGHAILYRHARWLVPTTKDAYRYPDSTRYIGFDPPTQDHAFTEFPAYGFYVGDLHAHLIATPLAIFALLVLLAMLRAGWEGTRAVPWQTAACLGALLGLAYGINAWDVAVTGLVALLVWLVLLARQRGGWGGRLWRLLRPTLVVTLAAVALAIPFAIHFEPFAEGIRPVLARTPAWQLLVVYWPGIPAALALLPWLARARGWPPERAFLVIMALAVAALIAIPEIWYVKDIYKDDHARANTMFKLSFRSQAMIQIAGVAIAATWAARPGILGKLVGLVVALPLALQLGYAEDTFRLPRRPLSLDGLAFLGDERPLAEAVAGLPPGANFVEGAGNSFTRASRISAMTGRATPVGWIAHEWLWRSAKDEAVARGAQVDAFYTTMTLPERCAFIARWNIRAIVVAREEAARTPALDRAGLALLGPVIARSPGGEVIQPDPQVCPE